MIPSSVRIPLQGQAHGKAAVLKCLVSQLDALDGICETEISRAARMALWEYTPGAQLLTIQHMTTSLTYYAIPASARRRSAAPRPYDALSVHLRRGDCPRDFSMSTRKEPATVCQASGTVEPSNSSRTG